MIENLDDRVDAIDAWRGALAAITQLWTASANRITPLGRPCKRESALLFTGREEAVEIDSQAPVFLTANRLQEIHSNRYTGNQPTVIPS